MAKIGELVMGIRANTSKAERNVKRFRKQVSLTSKVSRLAIKPLAGFSTALTGIGVGLTVGGAGFALKGAADNIDRIGKSSRNIGVSAQALGGLSHAARQTGVEFTSLTTGMRMLSKNVIDARDGTGAAKDAFEKLGINVKELAQLKPEQQIGLIADRMNTLTNSSEKVNVAMRIFGRSGTDLIETLALGSKGLSDMQSEADKLGKTFTDDQAKRVERMNDALANLKDIGGSLATGIVISMSPTAATVLEGFTDAWIQFNGTGKGQALDKTSGWFERNMPNVTELGVMLEKQLFDSGSTARSLAGGASFSQNVAGGRRAKLITDEQSVAKLRKNNLIDNKKNLDEMRSAVMKFSPVVSESKAIVSRLTGKLSGAVGSTASHSAFLFSKALAVKGETGSSQGEFVRSNTGEAGIMQRGSAAALLALRASTAREDKSLMVQKDQKKLLEKIADNTARREPMQELLN